MDEKNKSKTPLEEFKKLANDFRDVVTELGDILAKILPDIEIPEEEEEDTWEMKCPYEYGDKYFALNHRGGIIETSWDNHYVDEKRLEFGNTFPTEQAAELEAKRRNLLTRFRAFRDECNGDWKPDWMNSESCKYCLLFEVNEFSAVRFYLDNMFNQFGYFKNKNDALKAIELFGDEIKELFVDNEV